MPAEDVLVLQHVACEGPGLIAQALNRRNIQVRVVRIDQGEPVPREIGDAAGLIVMGGPMGVYEQKRYPHLSDELGLIERAVSAETPVLGVCLGSQLLAAALGAAVRPSGFKEIGWYEVQLQAAARTDGLFADLPARFMALHWHGDIFELPPGATSLARSQQTEHQAFHYGRSVYGLLFHLEASADQIGAMVRTFEDELRRAEIGPTTIGRGAKKYLAHASELGRTVFDRFAGRIGEPRP